MGDLLCSGAPGKYSGHEQLKRFYPSQILSQIFPLTVHQECTDFQMYVFGLLKKGK